MSKIEHEIHVDFWVKHKMEYMKLSYELLMLTNVMQGSYVVVSSCGIFHCLQVKNPWPNVDAHSGVLLNYFGLTEAR